MNINRFKNDHQAIMSSVTELRTLVKAGVADNAAPIAKAVIAMSSVIKLHLATEDNVLYPALAKATDPAISKLGNRFSKEMSGIATAYTAFARKWNLATSIQSDPAGFTAEASAVFRALQQRIQSENAELYPVAEKL